jgi:hypothetical protein
LQHHQLQQHQDQQAELLQQQQLQDQQQQQPQHFEFQGLKPLVVRRSFTGSSVSSTGHGTPRFASSDPGVPPAAAAAAAAAAADGIAAADGQYSVIPGQYGSELYSTEQQQQQQQQQQYNTWSDDVSRSALDACSIGAEDAADLDLTGTAAARAALVASAASNIQSMEAFAAVGNSSAAAVDDAAGVSGWEQQQSASAAASSVGTGSDDMV